MMGFQVPERIAWVDAAESEWDGLCLTRLPSGETVVLSGTARMIWLVAVDGGDVVPEVADLVAEAPEAIAPDVTRFLDELVHLGLLHRQEDT